MGIILKITDDKAKGQAQMKLAVLFLFLLFFTFPAQAYMEETADRNTTKLTAGEINTNYNRLNNQGIVSLKKLKQIDEMMARSPTAGDGSAQNVAKVSQLVAEQNSEVVREEFTKARTAMKLLADKTDLRHKTSSATIQTISEVMALNVRDEQVAAELLQQLARRGR